MSYANFWGQQFVDETGAPYGGVKVYHYEPGTTTDKTVWINREKSYALPQPVQGDSRGVATFFGEGRYRLRVVTNEEILLYDFDNVEVFGAPSGTESRVPYFGSDSTLTNDAFLTWDAANKRLGVGTTTNITQRIVVPNNSYFAGERSVASTAEGAKRIIGISTADKVDLDPDGLGVVLNQLNASGLLYLDANKQIKLLTLTDGQIPIGYSGADPRSATPTATGALAITPGPGSLLFTPTADSALVYNRANTAVTVANTTTETSLYGFSIQGSDLSTNRSLLIRMGGVASTTGSRTLTFRVSLGATDMYVDTSPNVPAVVAWNAWFAICNQTASAQSLYGQILISSNNNATTGTAGDLATGSGPFVSVLRGVATENSANTLRFDTWVTWSTNTTCSITCDYANAIKQ